MIGKPNNNTSLTLNNDNGKLATASKRMDWLLENSRIANSRHKVAPEPPIKAKLPSKPLLSRYSTGSPAANAAPLSATAWSRASNNGCMAYTP